MTLAEMLDKLEQGRIGHSEAMQWLGVDTHAALVELVHRNDRLISGHRVEPVTSETRALPRLMTNAVGWHSAGAST